MDQRGGCAGAACGGVGLASLDEGEQILVTLVLTVLQITCEPPL